MSVAPCVRQRICAVQFISQLLESDACRLCCWLSASPPALPATTATGAYVCRHSAHLHGPALLAPLFALQLCIQLHQGSEGVLL